MGEPWEVLSLNIWDVPLLAPHTPERIHALLDHARRSPRLLALCLQEAWRVDAAFTARLAAAGFPHVVNAISGARLPLGFRGSGLVVASRVPILHTSFLAFAARGSPLRALSEFDGWAGKGIQLARLALGGGATLDLYNTHLCASYGAAGSYAAARAAQAVEAANFIVATRRGGPAVCCGDLNAPPAALPPRLLVALCGLADAHEGGAPTCNVRSNAFARAGALPVKLDYVLFAGVAPAGAGSVLFSEPTVAVRGPRAWVNVSDHCGVACAFEKGATPPLKGGAAPAPAPAAPPRAPGGARGALLEEAAAALAAGVASCRASARARLRDAALAWAVAAAAGGFACGGGGGWAPAAALLAALAAVLFSCVMAAAAVEDGCFEATSLEASLVAVEGLQGAE
jgi:endonuclease/exonuclease/phosphatase family metal-dependent hydrolase